MRIQGKVNKDLEGIGVSIPQDQMDDLFVKMLGVLGFSAGEIGLWDFISAFDEKKERLEGRLRWVGNVVCELAKDALMLGWDNFSGLELEYSMKESACSVCNKQRRLVGIVLNVDREEFDTTDVASELMKIANLIAEGSEQ